MQSCHFCPQSPVPVIWWLHLQKVHIHFQSLTFSLSSGNAFYLDTMDFIPRYIRTAILSQFLTVHRSANPGVRILKNSSTTNSYWKSAGSELPHPFSQLPWNSLPAAFTPAARRARAGVGKHHPRHPGKCVCEEQATDNRAAKILKNWVSTKSVRRPRQDWEARGRQGRVGASVPPQLPLAAVKPPGQVLVLRGSWSGAGNGTEGTGRAPTARWAHVR